MLKHTSPRSFLTLFILAAVIGGSWFLSRDRADAPSAASPAALTAAARGASRVVSAPVPAPSASEVSQPLSPVRQPVPPVASAPAEIKAAALSITQVFPSIREAIGDWRQFRPEAITVAPGEGLSVTFTRVAVREEPNYVTWIGRNPDYPGSSFVGVATANGYDAILVLPGASQFSYHIRGDEVVVAEASPGEEGCGVFPAQAPRAPGTSTAEILAMTYTDGQLPVLSDHAVEAEFQVDVLFGYDEDTLKAAAAKSSDAVGYIDAQCKALLETSNLALAQSGVTKFAWRHLGVVPSKPYTRDGKSLTDIQAFGAGGVLEAWASTLRYQRGADQIVLLIGGAMDFGGRAFSSKQTTVATNRAAAVVRWTSSYKTLAHELAHNFGCQHDRLHIEYSDTQGAPDLPAPDSDGFWAYGQMWTNPPPPRGYTGTTGTSGTIMSYADWVIPYFSNPSISVHVTGSMFAWTSNIDLGIQQTGRAESDPKAAYNARVLNDNAPVMSRLSAEISMPRITRQPSGIAAVRDTNFLLSVTAEGGGLSYQWRKNGVTIDGATASSISKVAVDAEAGSYTVTVSNFAGTITSEPATVSVVAAPTQTTTTTTVIGGGSGSGGGGGGGGAPSGWFISALAACAALRVFAKHRAR